jgi:Ca2+-binding RTX toxin-like protein
MATLDVSGTLEFDIYTFSIAALLQEFTVQLFDGPNQTLKFSNGADPESYISFVGATAVGATWDGTITSFTYVRANVGQVSLAGIGVAAETFHTQALVNSRALFASLFSSNDTFTFADGLAKIEAGNGDDLVTGSSQDDYIVAGAGDDVVDAGLGFDTLDYSNHPNALGGIIVQVTGLGAGSVNDPDGDTDTFTGIERITGTAFADTFNGGSSTAEVNEWVGGNGADTFNGGDGFDTINYDAEKYTTLAVLNSGVIVNVNAGTATDSFGNSDSFNNIDAITATDLDDTFVGSNSTIAISLRAGDDSYTGGSGNEWINPGAGNDAINGRSGYDTVAYSINDSIPINFAGSLFVNGGIIVFGGNTLGRATVYDQYGDSDLLSNIEHISGSKQNDVFNAGSSTLTFTGNQGQDIFNSSFQTSCIIDYSQEQANGGTAGVSINLITAKAIDGFGDMDRIFGFNTFRGTALGDQFVGADWANVRLFAGDGNDVVALAAGDDWVAPGEGINNIDGGSGYDQLNYSDISPIGGQAISVFMEADGNGEVTKPNAEVDNFNAIELIFGTQGADYFNGQNYAMDFSGGAGSDTFTGSDSALRNDVVDYSAEQYFAGWRNGVTVNLSTATFRISSALSLSAGAAIDSYGDIDSLIRIDIIRGTGLNDVFIAGAKSVFEGGKGNDTYWLDGGDSAIEQFSGGIDTINAKTSMSLPAYIENLVLTGSAVWAVGNSSNNVITGNALNNSIAGNFGADVLSGKSGRDTFRFDTKLSASNRDIITDFSSTFDQISLDRSYFSKIGLVGKLASTAFYVGSAAHDSSDRIIYNKSTGALYYDADGPGSSAKILFVTLSNKASLNYTDFDIVA